MNIKRTLVLLAVLLSLSCPVVYADDVRDNAELGNATSLDFIVAVDESDTPATSSRRLLFNADVGTFLSGLGTWVDFQTKLNATAYSPTAAVDFTGAPSVLAGPLTFTGGAVLPTATGNLRYINTITGITDGALCYYNGTEVRCTVEFQHSALPATGGQMPLYNATSDKVIFKAMSGDGTLDEDGAFAIAANSVDDTHLNTTDQITVLIDGGGSAITTGVKFYVPVEWSATITQATVLCDQSGSIVVDIWKDTYANYPPTVADTITASAKPTVSTAIKAQDGTLTGWTTSITAGDILGFNVDSATTVEFCTVSLKVTR